MKTRILLSLLLAAPLFLQPAKAALAITDGAFNNGTGNGTSLTDWFESTNSTAWREGPWVNGGLPTVFTSGNMLIMDALGDGSYIYQNMGTVDLADLAQGTLRLSADFGEKSDGNTNTAMFQVFAGSFAAAADGVDIFGHASQPTLLASFTLDAAAQGLTAATGNNGRANGVLIGNVNLTGLSNGTQLWLRVVDSASSGFDNTGTGGDFLMDNMTATVVPEPSVALLGGLGALALLRRRRNG